MTKKATRSYSLKEKAKMAKKQRSKSYKLSIISAEERQQVQLLTNLGHSNKEITKAL
jgi:Holliday junction resolvasome RuvABC DNA-binding subunit